MTLEALVVGDIHLDKLSTLYPENHLDLQIEELNKTCNYAIKEGIPRVFYLGDICENSRMSSDAEDAFLRFLKKWDGKLESYFILGNHDWDESGVHSLRPFASMYELGYFKSTHVLSKPEVLKLSGVKVNFQSYPGTQSYTNHVNLGHFEVSGSTRDNGRKVAKSNEVTYDHLWLMGHLHTPHDVGNVFYPGTLYQMNFGESLPKGFIHFKARLRNGKLQHKVTRCKNDPKFKLFNLKVSSLKDLKRIEPNPLYKYKLFFQEKVELPDTLLTDYPNIVKIEGFKTAEEYDAAVQEAFIEISQQTLQLPPQEEMLKEFLKRKGATKSQVKRAADLLTKITPRV